jgi:p-hydroxybenzoate 3-monooxygenase
METQIAVVGGGPAGLTLGMLLAERGIESVILESRDRAYVEHRVRAGVLEQNTVDLLHALGVGDRLAREGLEHHGIFLRRPGAQEYVPMSELTGRAITVYGQQEVVKDLIAARVSTEAPLLFEVSEVELHDLETDRPRVSFVHDGTAQQLRCDFVAGCDGFHGLCRGLIPDGDRTELDYTYPFAWLGILAEAPPATEELIYAWHEHGFALYSMRSPTVSRLYLQVPVDEELDGWSDERLWDELELRLGTVTRGPIFDKGITPMRSFVTSPMQHGRLFLAGDAAHIVPPTGAKGLNLAVNDARLLAAGLAAHYERGDDGPLVAYTETALRRVWRAQDFSNYMTQLLHNLGGGPFEHGLQLSRLEYIGRSDAAARSLAENYVGLPAADDF